MSSYRCQVFMCLPFPRLKPLPLLAWEWRRHLSYFLLPSLPGPSPNLDLYLVEPRPSSASAGRSPVAARRHASLCQQRHGIPGTRREKQHGTSRRAHRTPPPAYVTPPPSRCDRLASGIFLPFRSSASSCSPAVSLFSRGAPFRVPPSFLCAFSTCYASQFPAQPCLRRFLFARTASALPRRLPHLPGIPFT